MHEFIKHLLQPLIITLTEELNLKVQGIGSVIGLVRSLRSWIQQQPSLH